MLHKKLFILGTIIGISLASSVVAAPTSTIVQNLIMTNVKNAPCLKTDANGLTLSTSCGSFTTTTINSLSLTDYLFQGSGGVTVSTSSATIGSITFTDGGSGLNDMSTGGSFTGLGVLPYKVQIDNTGLGPTIISDGDFSTDPTLSGWTLTDLVNWNGSSNLTFPSMYSFGQHPYGTASLDFDRDTTTTYMIDFDADLGALSDMNLNTDSNSYPITTGHNIVTTTFSNSSGMGISVRSDASGYGPPGTFTNLSIRPEIGLPDTFEWSKDNGASWVANNITITGSSQNLDNGISVLFTNPFGHAIGDAWSFTATQPAIQISYTESDPIFSSWLANTPPLYSESDPVYSANSYAVGMNQGVATGDNPSFVTINGITPSSILTSNAGDWAGTWQTHSPGDFLSSSTAYVATTTGNWLGKWQALNPSDFISSSTSFVTSSMSAGYITLATSTSKLVNSNIFQSGSNIGIGTTTPQTALNIYGDTSAPQLRIDRISVGGAAIRVGNPSQIFSFGLSASLNNIFTIATGTTIDSGNVLSITNSGNVGIGTTTPSYALSINGRYGTYGTAPTISSCGTGAATSTNSTDNSGTVTEGTLATGCTITFATRWMNPPVCNVTSQSGLVFTYAKTTSTLVVTNVGALSSTKLDWSCTGK